MGVFYPQSCSEPGDMRALALSCGYPELGPVMAMSAAALDRRGLAQMTGAEHFTLLEILVTSTRARGRGVATGIVGEIMSECNYNINTNVSLEMKCQNVSLSELATGVIICVATSPGTEKILKRLGWKKWKTIDLQSTSGEVDQIFVTLESNFISSFMFRKGI